MNIFYLHPNPKQCAAMHTNKHVIKMILESTQLLCSALHSLDGIQPFYKPTHKNHPCNIWVRSSRAHWLWVRELTLCLNKEYQLRYKRVCHRSALIASALPVPKNFPTGEWLSTPPQCMPEQYKHSNTVIAYHQYYMREKLK